MKEDLGNEINSTIIEVQMAVSESEESFIFGTIKPFCEEVLSLEISKKELEEMLLRAERMKWIPCNERLPKKYTNVIVSFNHGTVMELIYSKDGVFKGEYGDYTTETIDAWMPLPEPYKGE